MLRLQFLCPLSQKEPATGHYSIVVSNRVILEEVILRLQFTCLSPRRMLSECNRSNFGERIGSHRGAFIRFVDQKTTIWSCVEARCQRGSVP